MDKKLHILLVCFSNRAVKIKTIKNIAIHQLFANIVKILEVCKHSSQDLVNAKKSVSPSNSSNINFS